MLVSLHKTFVMDKIRNIYQEGLPLAEEYDTLIPDKIEVLDCVTHEDCSYTETIKLSFYVGNERGAFPGPGTRKFIELDIDAGYRRTEEVRAALASLLFPFKIFQLERLLDAFEYRRFYCRD